MEPSKSKRKWVIFGGIIVVLAVLIAVGPVIIARYMRSKPKPVQTAEFMIKVSGTIQKDNDTLYLKGDNQLYYVLIGDKIEELSGSLNKEVTVFGTMYEPKESESVAGNPIRFKIGVVKFEKPTLNPSAKK
jgi:hypothetical protein